MKTIFGNESNIKNVLPAFYPMKKSTKKVNFDNFFQFDEDTKQKSTKKVNFDNFFQFDEDTKQKSTKKVNFDTFFSLTKTRNKTLPSSVRRSTSAE
jgi:hypothetical protein